MSPLFPLRLRAVGISVGSWYKKLLVPQVLSGAFYLFFCWRFPSFPHRRCLWPLSFTVLQLSRATWSISLIYSYSQLYRHIKCQWHVCKVLTTILGIIQFSLSPAFLMIRRYIWKIIPGSLLHGVAARWMRGQLLEVFILCHAFHRLAFPALLQLPRILTLNG